MYRESDHPAASQAVPLPATGAPSSPARSAKSSSRTSALLGALADQVGIETVYRFCSFLPAMGLLAWFLPRPSTGADV